MLVDSVRQFHVSFMTISQLRKIVFNGFLVINRKL